MSTTTTTEENLSKYILEQGWQEGAASPDRIMGFMQRHDAHERIDLETMSDEEFEQLLA